MSIKQNISSLQNLLEQVNALPEAGGSVGTCTVTVDFYGNGDYLDACATVLDASGAIKTEAIQIIADKPKAIQCVCNTLIGINVGSVNGLYASDNMNMMLYDGGIYILATPTTPGDVATIDVRLDAGGSN